MAENAAAFKDLQSQMAAMKDEARENIANLLAEKALQEAAAEDALERAQKAYTELEVRMAENDAAYKDLQSKSFAKENKDRETIANLLAEKALQETAAKDALERALKAYAELEVRMAENDAAYKELQSKSFAKDAEARDATTVVPGKKELKSTHHNLAQLEVSVAENDAALNETLIKEKETHAFCRSMVDRFIQSAFIQTEVPPIQEIDLENLSDGESKVPPDENPFSDLEEVSDGESKDPPKETLDFSLDEIPDSDDDDSAPKISASKSHISPASAQLAKSATKTVASESDDDFSFGDDDDGKELVLKK